MPGVLANDDNDGNPMTAALVTNPTNGTVVFNADGSFKYTPNAGFVGTDTFTYHDTNTIGTGNTATVTISVQARTPIAANDHGTGYYDTTLVIAAPGVLGNDSSGGETIIAQLVTSPTHGTLTFNSDGSFKYVPNTGFLGTDSFTYQAVNSIGASNTATCTLTIQTRTPVAANDHGTGYYDTPLVISAPGVLGNDYTGGSPTTAALVTNPTHGTISFNSDGSFTYTPTTGYLGTDSFTYQDTNAVGTSNVATCTLTVQPRTPIAVNNSNNVPKNGSLSVPAPGVLGNDNDGGSSPMTAMLVTTTSHGTLTLNSNGAFTYTPNAGFTGTDSFTYQAVNSIGKSNIATATLNVQ